MLKPDVPAIIPDDIDGVYRVVRPATPLPLIFDSPHSGRIYPVDFKASCPIEVLRQAEDNHVDALLAGVTRHGATLLTAEFPRTYIDVNRDVADIDPELVQGPMPHDAAPTARSAAGIGLVRRLIRPGVPLYSRKLTVAEVGHRLNGYYHPYHQALAGLIEAAHYNFGVVWHVDCHSMPVTNGRDQADFVLGDRNGTSCATDFIQALQNFLQALGYKVALNHPYKGVEIVRRYGHPDRGYNSLQLEINKALYWNEDRMRFNRRAADTMAVLDRLAAFCARFAQTSLLPMAAD